MAVKSPLKWAGSKVRVMHELSKHLPPGKRLVEPFAGSCAVMMNTDYDSYLIGDVNPDLIHLYQYIKMDVEQFIRDARRYFEVCISAEDYYRVRFDFNTSTDWQSRAAMFLYLNRHCFNGLARYNQRGGFNVPYGKYKSPYFPEIEIRSFAEKAKRATFICADFTESLDLVVPGDVVYCDPPYNPEGSAKSFTKYHSVDFDITNQKQLAAMLANLVERGIPVVASNSDSELTYAQYGAGLFELHKINVARSVGAATGGSSSAPEIIAVSYPVCQP
ncbi:Dam family site-specific DNA-(adenine-N6)-methyltransferase [Pantoea sp. CTOTU50773]|uniref:Dam family site-specific DNA-(adenine-N6)-methyltransferase n=1 Tax=Pantoea sp. CTOTU50773 TaxID=2953853 RepID=UPI0028B0120A|nr:Dam family site-specific DNA-(adenine-N6)-methyltransferase [Pantoea sp. CTOTU50773]